MKISKYNNRKNVSGDVLRALRIKANLSQADVAKELQLLGIGLTRKTNY